MLLTLIFLLMLINLILALSVFVLIARPEKLMFFLSKRKDINASQKQPSMN